MDFLTNPPAPSGIPEIRFSTEHFPERERVAAWQEIFGRHIVNVDVVTLRDEPLNSNVVARALPGLGLAHIAHMQSGFRAIRTRELISRGGDDIVFNIVAKGAMGFSQFDREAMANAGKAVAVSSTRVGHSVCITPDLSDISLRIPRSALSPMVRDVEAACARALPVEPVTLLRRYVAAARDPSLLATQDLQHAFVTHVYDLAAIALGATRDAAEVANGRGVRVARLRAIKADILANLRRPDLSLDTLAKRQGISPRYIRLLFKSEATSFSDFLRAQRLARAHRILSSPQYAALAISTIAYDVGFSDLTHFNHAFRRAYGATPSDVRATALRERGG